MPDPPDSKKARYEQKWKVEYGDKFPILTEYTYRNVLGKKVVDPIRAYCKACKKSFKISHGGLNDCKKHCETDSHKIEFAKYFETTPLDTFLDNSDQSQSDTASIRAAALMGLFIVQQNLSISSLRDFVISEFILKI